MFNKDNQIWLYLIGIIIMFGILIATSTNIILPAIQNPQSIDLFRNDFNTKPEFKINPQLDYQAYIETNYGRISIDLFEKNAPNNVNNFIYLAQNGYYTNTKFHRLIKDFLLQGGDRNTLNSNLSDDGQGRPGYLIDDEINWDSLELTSERRTVLTELGFKNTPGITTPKFAKYIIGLANGGANTNGSQFFILINNNSDARVRELDGMYTPLAMVTSGFDVLDEIAKVSVENAESQSPKPSQDIIIQKIEIFTK